MSIYRTGSDEILDFSILRVKFGLASGCSELQGMIKPLTNCVMDTACKQRVAWKNACKPNLQRSVNISARYFLDPDIIVLIDQVLKNKGIRVAIDDFGVGHSSFASLKHLQVDFLKIDRCVIEDIPRDEQLVILREMAYRTARGFLFSKPVPVDEMRTLLEQNN